jgi:CDP-diacylglycerol--glycerol-3-phosphate 3-phosphatidyltransferase
MLFNVPNIITFGRILVIPIIAVLLMFVAEADDVDYNKKLSLWTAVIFTIAAISDLVDGYYARKYGEVSIAGKFFDPMADKLIHMTAMVMLIPLGRLPAWLVVILLFREIFITGLRSMAVGEGVIIDAATWGKRKTAWLNVGIIALIVHYPVLSGTFLETNSRSVGLVCLVIATLYSMASGIAYTWDFFSKMKRT